MIHIEKLSLKNVGRYTWQTFVDQFIGTKETRSYLLEKHRPNTARSYINSHILTPLLLPKLKGVALGKYYGMTGADIDDLLAAQSSIENLVIEMSVDHINATPKNKLKALLESYPVMLWDFEEGGNLFVNDDLNLVKFLTERNIKPKQLFLVGGAFQMKDFPELNIHKIYYDHWLIISATWRDYIIDKKQQLLDTISSCDPPNFCIAPMFKPRIHRILLLSYLDSINVLDDCVWSLGYNFSYKNKFLDVNDGSYKNNQSNVNAINTFLSKHTLPKLLPNNPYKGWEGILLHDTTLFNQYKYYLVVETFLGDELVNPMGGCGFITEKTHKCFLTASAPIIYGPKETNDQLKKLGFRTLTENIDISDYCTIGDFVKELRYNQKHEKELIQHNFDLVTNKSFLAEQAAEPLNKIAELINSIRR